MEKYHLEGLGFCLTRPELASTRRFLAKGERCRSVNNRLFTESGSSNHNSLRPDARRFCQQVLSQIWNCRVRAADSHGA